MKKYISVILAAALVSSLFAACGAEKNDETEATTQAQPATETAKEDSSPIHTLYFRDSAKSSKAVATFFNSDSGKSEEVEMKKIGEDSDSVTFSCEGDTSSYNMAYGICDGKEPERPAFNKFAFNKCVSGWYKTEGLLLPYTEGTDIDFSPKFDDVTLTCIDYDKLIHIWKPEDYDPSSDEKYSTIYMLDGDNIVITETDELSGCLFVPEQVKAMSSSTGNKAIVVAIENVGKRDFELIPNIGNPLDGVDFEEEGIDGTKFADFVANTVMPYVQKNYNVYTDALHTSVTGASLGGLEAFYIATEYPDKFGSAGSFSPSFWLYDETTWEEYLSKKSFSDSSPFLYFYTGPGMDSKKGSDTDPFVSEMYSRLKEMGYPAAKMVLHLNEEGLHDASMWRTVYPEFLNAMVFQRVEPLQK